MHRRPRLAWKATELTAKHLRRKAWSTSRHFRSYHDNSTIKPVATIHGCIDLDAFRSSAWEPAIPTRLQGLHQLPAMNNWFTSDFHNGKFSFSDKFWSFAYNIVSYELVAVSPKGSPSSIPSSACLEHFKEWLETLAPEDDGHHLCSFVSYLIESVKAEPSGFLRFDAPLGLISRASQFNKSRHDSSGRLKQLYIAQSDIRSLPDPLAEDLPVPEIVRKVGRGDIYSSSIWLGLQPTYTPLHRDPNPNLFVQLVGSKAVRLLQPRDGQSVFQAVRRSLGSTGSSRFRGPEMMYGPERDGCK
jgi:hypothetical protein